MSGLPIPHSAYIFIPYEMGLSYEDSPTSCSYIRFFTQKEDLFAKNYVKIANLLEK